MKPVVIIPARSGSKRYPDKNIDLWRYTSSFLQSNRDLFKEIYVSTDSKHLAQLVEEAGFKSVKRPPELSTDELPVNPVMYDVITKKNLYKETVCMMYLTSPERKREEFENAINFYNKNNLESLVAFYRPEYSPYLARYEDTMEPLINHDLYRYQDYRNIVVLSHYICLFNADSLYKLDNQLYRKEITHPWLLDYIPVDIDYKEQLRQWQLKKY